MGAFIRLTGKGLSHWLRNQKMENHIPDLDEVGCRFHPERHLKDTLEKFK